MINENTDICVCNSLNAGDIAECVKKNNFSTLEQLLANHVCPMGDKCESCQEDGYNNDGLNLSLVLALVKRGEL